MRQHTTPLMLASLSDPAVSLVRRSISSSADERGYQEAFIQRLVFENPGALPLREVDPTASKPFPLCIELGTPAGPVDVAMITREGMPVLVECKLWSNPQARREVVGQILDYAKEIRTWSYEDLEACVARARKEQDYSLFREVSDAFDGLEEADFIDAVTANLRRGRCLLLLVGDGIREGVEAIGEYLAGSGSLEFAFGMIELPVFDLPEGGHIVTPRVVAKTTILERYVVSTVSDDIQVKTADEVAAVDHEISPREAQRISENLALWTEYDRCLVLDDKSQQRPNINNQSNIFIIIPSQHGGSVVKGNWVTLYVHRGTKKIGLFVTGTVGAVGGEIMARLVEEFDDLKTELGDELVLADHGNGKINIGIDYNYSDLADEEERTRFARLLAKKSNDFVNAFRPRIERIARSLG